MVENIVLTHEKKLRNLTKNTALPFTTDEVITNMSSYELTSEENEILKNGLSFAIPPKRVSKADVFTTFEMVSRFMTSNLKQEDYECPVKAELSYLANLYVSEYRPSRETLKKHKILNKLRDNTNIVICKPDRVMA